MQKGLSLTPDSALRSPQVERVLHNVEVSEMKALILKSMFLAAIARAQLLKC